MPPPNLAAVDCGTNSTRLLVADPEGKPLERLMRITRLGAGVDRTGAIDPAALERTLEVLREFRGVMDRLEVGAARVTATSAARDAANRDAFFEAATEVLGVTPELLGGEAEGRLSFAGATAELDPARGPYLVADIGGGSTELAAGEAGAPPEAVVSTDVGCVRVTERYLRHDPPEPAEIEEASAAVGDLLDGALRSAPGLRKGRSLVGLAGTVSALAALDSGLDGYDRSAVHHHVLTRDAVAGMLELLSSEDAAARRRRPGIEAQRADVIVGGVIVLDTLMERLGFGECLTSESDILDGLIMSLRRSVGDGVGP